MLKWNNQYFRSAFGKKLIVALLFTLLFAFALHGQENGNENGEAEVEQPDPLRLCPAEMGQGDVPDQAVIPEDSRSVYAGSPTYRDTMQQVLNREMEAIREAAGLVVEQHQRYIELFPEESEYHEIVMDYTAGAWRSTTGQTERYINSYSILALSFNNAGELECMTLDRRYREVEQPQNWVRRIFRVSYPQILSTEFQTLADQFDRTETLAQADPEIQLRALRRIRDNLREARYVVEQKIINEHQRRQRAIDYVVD